jgi:hypothetical protein
MERRVLKTLLPSCVVRAFRVVVSLPLALVAILCVHSGTSRDKIEYIKSFAKYRRDDRVVSEGGTLTVASTAYYNSVVIAELERQPAHMWVRDSTPRRPPETQVLEYSPSPEAVRKGATWQKWRVPGVDAAKWSVPPSNRPRQSTTSLNYTASQAGWRIHVSYWLILLPLSMPLLLQGVRAILRRARRMGRRCMECSYDLRASVDRCPECGTVIPL